MVPDRPRLHLENPEAPFINPELFGGMGSVNTRPKKKASTDCWWARSNRLTTVGVADSEAPTSVPSFKQILPDGTVRIMAVPKKGRKPVAGAREPGTPTTPRKVTEVERLVGNLDPTLWD